MTNELVKDNEGCLTLVNDTIDFIDSKNYDNLPVPPRKSLEIPAIIARGSSDFLCYFPGENSWCKLGKIPYERCTWYDNFFSCEGKLYSFKVQSLLETLSYNPYTNNWKRLPPSAHRCMLRIFTGYGDEMYALLSSICCSCTRYLEDGRISLCDKEHSWFVSKYKPKSHSWEDILVLDQCCPKFKTRRNFCPVASDRFIYFIGGVNVTQQEGHVFEYLRDVDRYDLSKNQWDKVADIHVARSFAYGVAVNGKVFIAGGIERVIVHQCEVYDEATNEWQIIAPLENLQAPDTLLAVDGQLYAVRCTIERCCVLKKIMVECYNPEMNEWEMKTEIPLPMNTCFLNFCSARIFKGLCNIRHLEASTPNTHSEALTSQACSSHDPQAAYSNTKDKRKCFIM